MIEAWRADDTLDIAVAVEERLDGIRRSTPRRVVNATGVILHTNLGRAPWPDDAVEAAAEVARGYSNTELDLVTGERGRRNPSVERLLVQLTGADAALVVNNNAAALFASLMTLAAGGRVPVSRGELIEIGGSYRLPELMAATSSELVEVGTTNRTRIADYEAVTDPVALLKVHASNYRLVGFTEDASVADLVALARRRGIPMIHDVGSGLLDEDVPWLSGRRPQWLDGEPGVRQSLEAGADLVLFSGDKLLGGPQAGIVVGRSELVERLRRHPVARALRIDGPTAAALSATLAAYLRDEVDRIPLWRMASLDVGTIDARARAVAGSCREASVVDGVSTVGAGSAPGAEIPTRVIHAQGADALHRRLLSGNPPILGRRHRGAMLLDLRTVDPADDHFLAEALATPWR